MKNIANFNKIYIEIFSHKEERSRHCEELRSTKQNNLTTLFKKVSFFCSLCFVFILNAQSQNQNYIKTITYKKPTNFPLPVTPIDVNNPAHALVSVGYFDGLGRPIQQVAHQQSSTGKDIVTHIEYDAFGRQTKEFLPYVNSTASLGYKTSAATDVLSYYTSNNVQETTSYPFSEKLLEASPLNRVLKQAAPGNAWALGTGKEIKMDYQTNVANDQVRLYNITTTWDVAKGLYELPTTLPSNVFYANGELYKTITYDENSAATPTEGNGATVEFKDKQGKVILKRTYNVPPSSGGVGGGTAHDTYYVYDQFGNLTYVIPPLVDTNVASISGDVLNNLCYQYKYDYRNRLVEKKLPGKQWEYIVYDKLDRVRATGPTYSPFSNHTNAQQGWLVTKYDVFNRPLLTGFVQTNVTATTRKTLQDTFTAATINFNESKSSTASTSDGIAYNYSNVSWPTAFNLLTVNYYDNYNFPNAPSPVPTTIITDTDTFNVLANVKTLATGSFTRVCTSISATAGETTYMLYDDKARPIGVYTKNHLGGHTNTVSKLDFAGQVQYTIQKHKRTNTSTEITVKETFTYSPQGRLLTHTHKINNKPEEVLARNEYDELGQLITNKIGGATTNTNGLQQVDTQYNIRGWLTKINDINTLGNDLFAFKINYNNPDANYQGTALYNGNISQTHWRTSSNNILKSYGYTYDGLNRLLNAKYYAGTDPANTDRYNENLQYDKNGNITSLLRYGSYNTHKQLIDVLNYEYTGNQLLNVNEASNGHLVAGFKDGNVKATTNLNDYQYDNFGNMIIDRNKGITGINYNHLNLPSYIVFNNNNQTSIHYTYNAAGQKVKKSANLGTIDNVSGTSFTDYFDGYQYNNDVLQFFPHAQGYVKHTVNPSNGASEFDYVYQYKDHLGNIRINYTFDPASSSLKVLEENHYYPFGLKHQENLQARSIRFLPSTIASNEWIKGVGYLEPMPIAALVSNSGYLYRFGNKEYQDELGLDVYDYDNRIYDPSYIRFWQTDPKAEQGRRWSPYNYCFDNPIYFQDPDGMWPIPSWNQVKGFAKGFGNTMANTAMGLATTGLTPSFSKMKAYSETGVQIAKGNYKGALEIISDVTGVTAVTKTVKAAANGDPEALGSITAVVATVLVAKKLGGTNGTKGTVASSEGSLIAEAKSVHPKVNTTTLESGPYAGSSIPARSSSQTFTVAERNAINEIGSTEGCHTCGTTTSGRASGNFTPDHQPVSALVPEGTPQVLYPHCQSCSSSQGGTTSALIRKGYNVDNVKN